MTTSIAIGAAAALAISAAPAFAASSTPTPKASPSVTSAVPAPKNVVATPGNGRITLTWSAPKGANSIIIPDYSLLWGPTGGSLTVFKDGVSPATRGVITGLKNGVAYDVAVSAVTASGTGAQAKVVRVTPKASSTPSASPR
ncbi:MAG: fibronectin type III domain-containing protein [Candidatus Nanopelagicales bacterium]|nr:fibronectin type III domain-containing protein [Candidatus Nanopelagicales bacterium]